MLVTTPKNPHEHSDGRQSKSALFLALCICVVIFVVEVGGGFWTHSLSLLSDAVHVFMDAFSFLLSLSALYIAEHSISDRRTFGWHRLEVFAALINALTVVGVAFFIFFKAVQRFRDPQPVLGPEMLVIAVIGLIANLYVIWKLHKHSQKDLNIRSAFMHAVGDAAASVAVVAGGIIVSVSGIYMIDSAVAILVSIIILVYAYKIFGESVHILLEGVPLGLVRQEVIGSIEEISGKGSVRDLHIWNVCSHICALSLHLLLEDAKMSQQKELIGKINGHLEKKFNITHTTIQIEFEAWQKEV